MEFSKLLYTSANAEKKKKKIMKKLQTGAGMVNVYVITLASNGVDMLDIYHSAMLLQPALRDRIPVIVGIACGYDEALELVMQMLSDVYEQKKDYNLRRYFEDWQKEETNS